MRIACLSLLVTLSACSGSSKQTTVANRGPSDRSDVAIAFVVNGAEIWMGNEEHETEPAAQYPGALHGLRAALAKDPPASRFGAGSQAVVITYGEGAAVRLPLGPLGQLGPDALGKQIEYRSKLGTALVLGVDLGLAELEKATAPRRVLIVIGDGNDTNNEAATPALAAIKAKTKVEIYALVYKASLSAETSIVPALTSNVKTVTSADGFSAALTALWAQVGGK